MTDKPEGEATLFLAIDPICEAFEFAFQADSPPRIEDYLARVGVAQQERLLRELCAIEIEQRIRQAEEIALAEYLERFPDYQQCLTKLAQQHPEWNLKSTAPVSEETVNTVSPQEDIDSQRHLEPLETATTPAGSTEPAKSLSRNFGDYELLEEIGQGGMGIIYKARQRKLNRIVAVKMIRAGQLASPSDIQRFQSEAEAIGRLDHPQIVPIYEVDDVDGIHFFSMAFVDGEDLNSKLRDGPLPPRQAAQLVHEIALAIHYAHQQGIIHRDLKPANILLTRDGHVRVTDFGLAKHQDTDQGPTVTGEIVGTPGYMSPEQAAGKRMAVGTASDVYSLGAILYSLLTGRPPFQAATILDTLLQVINDNPVSPRQLNPAVARDLETVCLKCLEKTAIRRYPSAQELSAELKRFVNGLPIQAQPIGALSRVWRWCCRRPKLAAAWSIVAVLLLFLGIAGPVVALQQTRLKNLAIKQRQRADQQTKLTFSQKKLITKQATEAKRTLYLARMNMAYSAWENANMRSMRRLLNLYQTPEAGKDYRGFEWYYLDELAHEESLVIKAHPATVKAVDIRPGSEEMGTIGDDSFVRIWNTKTGVLVHEVDLKQNAGYALDYSADGSLLAVACRRGDIKFFDSETGQLRKQIKVGDRDLMKIALLPDLSKCIVSNGHGGISLVETETGVVTLLLKEHPTEVNHLSAGYGPGRIRYSPKPFTVSQNGKLLSFVDEKHDVVIWDLELGKEKHRIKRTEFSDISPNQSILAFGQDGNWLIHGDKEGEISVWHPPSISPLLKYRDHYQYIYDLAVSSDQRFLFSAGHDRTIHMRELGDTDRQRTIRVHESPVTCLAIAPQGQFIVGGDMDGFVRLVSLRKHANPRSLISPTGQYFAAAFHPSKQEYALVQSDGNVAIWKQINHQSDRILTGHKKAIHSVAYHPNGQQLASGSSDGSLCFWNSETTELLREWKGHEAWVHRVAYSPDGKLLASISLDKNLKIWQVDSGALVQSIPLENMSVNHITWNPSATRIAPGARFGPARIYDVKSGKPVLSLPGILGTYSPDGRRLVYAKNNMIYICDSSNGENIATTEGHFNPILDVIVTPDSQRVIAFDAGGMIKVWDMVTAQELLTIQVRSSYRDDLRPVTGILVMNPDGKKLALVQNDGNVKVWFARKVAAPQ